MSRETNTPRRLFVRSEGLDELDGDANSIAGDGCGEGRGARAGGTPAAAVREAGLAPGGSVATSLRLTTRVGGSEGAKVAGDAAGSDAGIVSGAC